MAVTVNVHWQHDAALFTLMGELGPQVFDLLVDAFAVARVDARTIVVDVREARLSPAALRAFRRALDRAKVANVVVVGGDGLTSVDLSTLGPAARVVSRPEDATLDGVSPDGSAGNHKLGSLIDGSR